jgi:hypothetical protein
MKITPKDWADFQHYKDRDPPWIKLHKKLLDNYEFHLLPDASQALAPKLWLLASEFKDGVIEGTEQKICFRLHTTIGKLNDALMPLVEAGFFTVEHGASEVIAAREHGASPRRDKAEEQVETQGETEVPAFAEALNAYNLVASELGWPQAEILNRQRKAKLAKRLESVDGVGGWRAAMARARASPWLRGDVPRGKGYETWSPDLDFFLQESTFTKLMEGKYDSRNPTAGSGSKNDNFLAGVFAAIGEANAQRGDEERADRDIASETRHALPPPGLRTGAG